MAHPGKTIGRWMRERKVSENELARATNVKQPTIHRIITGESRDPRRANLEKLARYFGRDVEDLFDPKAKPAEDSFTKLPEDERLAKLVAEFARLKTEDVAVVERILKALNSSRS